MVSHCMSQHSWRLLSMVTQLHTQQLSFITPEPCYCSYRNCCTHTTKRLQDIIMTPYQYSSTPHHCFSMKTSSILRRERGYKGNNNLLSLQTPSPWVQSHKWTAHLPPPPPNTAFSCSSHTRGELLAMKLEQWIEGHWPGCCIWHVGREKRLVLKFFTELMQNDCMPLRCS